MRFLEFVVDGQAVRRRKADPVASAVYPVHEKAWHYQDPEAQIELVEERFHGWLPGLLPPRRTWVTPIISDDGYPLRFETPGYRLERDEETRGKDEVRVHELTNDVAMIEAQKNSGGDFWNLPLSVALIAAALGFLVMIVAWALAGNAVQ